MRPARVSVASRRRRSGSSEPVKVEHLDVKITAAQGLLYAFDSLYVSVNGGPGSGLYRLRDTKGNDQFDEVVKLRPLAGGGEHGPHAVRLSPDGKSLFFVCGNHTDLPPKIDGSRVPRNWGEDLLLPRQWDANGHARGRMAPGGWIAKTDPDGKTIEIFSVGYRNAYRFAFNADGELFAYDSDMEWDMGMPWYRPTRAMHAVSGSEFGWRSGTGKWPAYYVDSLPAMVNIGPGSPVGMSFGYGTKFPAKYQKALYLLDWTFGTIYALHLEPDGSTYKAVKEEFLSRTPLPLTDVAVGPDGALYFTVGGRGTQSELYRVTYVGKESTAPADLHDSRGAERGPCGTSWRNITLRPTIRRRPSSSPTHTWDTATASSVTPPAWPWSIRSRCCGRIACSPSKTPRRSSPGPWPWHGRVFRHRNRSSWGHWTASTSPDSPSPSNGNCCACINWSSSAWANPTGRRRPAWPRSSTPSIPPHPKRSTASCPRCSSI